MKNIIGQHLGHLWASSGGQLFVQQLPTCSSGHRIVRQSPGGCQAVIRWSSDSCLAIIRQLSDSHEEFVMQLASTQSSIFSIRCRVGSCVSSPFSRCTPILDWSEQSGKKEKIFSVLFKSFFKFSNNFCGDFRLPVISLRFICMLRGFPILFIGEKFAVYQT